MSTRFDKRTVSTFKKDIKFGTMLEKYFFREWLRVCKFTNNVKVLSWADNGCGNDGEFISKGSTFGADYIVNVERRLPSGDLETIKSPLEVKWVPTAGKFTLKENDLRAYIKEEASILFIYNSVKCGTNLRKPKDYDLEKHIKLIESKKDQLKWGIMWAEDVKDFYKHATDNDLIRPINYMGGKRGVVLKQQDFNQWFGEEQWI